MLHTAVSLLKQGGGVGPTAVYKKEETQEEYTVS